MAGLFSLPRVFPSLCVGLFSFVCCSIGSTADREVKPFIDWLLEDEGRLEHVAFAEVVEAVSACSVLPVDVEDATDQAMLTVLESALDAMLDAFADESHPIHSVGRVNEISRYVEDFLLSKLNEAEAYACTIPLTASGEPQRSGYPDLRFMHRASGRVFYIDPKVYKAGSERSSFRTFYFEPKRATNKILDDASHLIVGVAHGGKVDAHWQMQTWKLIDLIDFEVRLKAEFQASNRGLYREDAILSVSESHASD